MWSKVLKDYPGKKTFDIFYDENLFFCNNEILYIQTYKKWSSEPIEQFY